jgi:hypothetical protein
MSSENFITLHEDHEKPPGRTVAKDQDGTIARAARTTIFRLFFALGCGNRGNTADRIKIGLSNRLGGRGNCASAFETRTMKLETALKGEHGELREHVEK